jgi:arabinogalactan endo-1,4-beta-galactosidase
MRKDISKEPELVRLVEECYRELVIEDASPREVTFKKFTNYQNPEIFNFSEVNDFATVVGAAGLNSVTCLARGYKASHYSDYPDWDMELRNTDFEEFEKYLCYYVYNAVLNFKDQGIRYYLIENELNMANSDLELRRVWTDWPNDKILRTLEVACKVAKKADPNCKLIINVVTPLFGWIGFLDRIEKAKIDYDVIGIDFYPCPIPMLGNPRFGWLLTGLVKIAKNRYEKPVIIMETGYHTVGALHNYKRQAKYIDIVCEAAKRGNASGIFIYRLRDGGDY